jgi:hypothetical protein
VLPGLARVTLHALEDLLTSCLVCCVLILTRWRHCPQVLPSPAVGGDVGAYRLTRLLPGVSVCISPSAICVLQARVDCSAPVLSRPVREVACALQGSAS